MKPTSLSPDQVKLFEFLKDEANGKKVLLQKKSALASSPNILELLSHSFFVGGYFVGPQFTMKKYQQVNSNLYYRHVITVEIYDVFELGDNSGLPITIANSWSSFFRF